MKVFANDTEILSALNASVNRDNKKYLAMYSSQVGGIITNPALMNIPLDDHMVHRGHGVFESCYVHNRKIFNLHKHILRLFRSANYAKITPPVDETDLEKMLIDFAKFIKVPDFGLKVYLSSGGGNFGITPVPNNSQLYFVAIDGAYETKREIGIKEYVVDPVKSDILVNLKSTNYLLNALAAMQSSEQGGYMGIQADREGYLLEAPVANIAIVSAEGEFLVPPFTKTLAGTTVIKAMKYLCEEEEGKKLVSTVHHANIHRDDAYNAKEVMIIGGDKCVPVTHLDNVQIGTGERGIVATALQKFLYRDFVQGDTTDLDVDDEGEDANEIQ
eukprot:CAMPEP_0114996324 /NCGR_PEP_ID=MMETSP0216-20121206/14239_1 /TAXON_ID=223996 /ORGANISM="Protocruzia adherens, Strain Boccale" /LENGTH=329 /DNA_ID=CAMNT_0002360499 /DNA_START=117 /DNA_END=1106 /DNA_ORIENTATION=+